MNWLNLNVQTLDSEHFLGSDPVDRATWLCLLRYCIGQENSGVIADCKEWTDRKWQQLVRVTKEEADRRCELWKWEGGTLTVWGYPVDKEDEVQRKRDAGRLGGKAKSEAKVRAARANGAKHHSSKTQAAAEAVYEAPTQATGEAPTEAEPKLPPKGKEWKGMGMEVRRTPPDPRRGNVGALAEAIWKLCPRFGRERSSQAQLVAQLRILPAMVLLDGEAILVSLRAWTLSESWTREEGRFVPGIHRWVKDGKWQSSPEPAVLKKGRFAGIQEDIDLPL